jgi:hypothetical protein
MMKYPGTSYNVFCQQIAEYAHLKRKITEIKLRKSPYPTSREH